MPVRMIITDLDGTLLRSDKTVSDYTAGVFRRCQERGIKVVFATARAVRVAKVDTKNIRPDYIIADNGAVVDRGGEIIRRIPIPGYARDELIARLTVLDEVSVLAVETGERLITNYNGAPWAGGWGVWNRVYSDFSNGVKDDVTKIIAECANLELISGIVGDYKELHLYSYIGEDWRTILHRDATKLAAAAFAAESLGFGLESAVAFGDDYNDLDMLRGCGIGVAMGNAIAEAKAAADFVCGTNDGDGAARWLEENVL